MGNKSDNARTAVSAPRLSLAAARELLLSIARSTGEEEIEPSLALGRTSSQAVYSRHANPNYRAAAMDGIAVRATDTITASEISPCTLPEHRARDTAPAGTCAPVDTGMAMPDWADAVVMVEDSKRVNGSWQITSPVTVGKHVRRAGEDVGAGVQLLGRGCRVGATEIGAMLATGVELLKLRLPPTVAILATGDEVVQPGQAAAPGAVIEFNSRVLAAMLQERGAKPVYLGHVADDPAELARVIGEGAATHDLLCVIAGSSAGRRDHTVDVLARLGDVLVRGVDLVPGRPAIIARANGTPILGIPGYPVSAWAVCRELLLPLVDACLGGQTGQPTLVTAELLRAAPSRLGVEELVRVCLRRDRERLLAAPLPRSSGSITTLLRADAILRIAAHAEGAEPGPVELEMLRPLDQALDTPLLAGDPHPMAELLAELSCRDQEHDGKGRDNVPAPAWLGLGAADGLLAVARGEADLALLDEQQAASLGEDISRATETGARLLKLGYEDKAFLLVLAEHGPVAERIARALADKSRVNDARLALLD